MFDIISRLIPMKYYYVYVLFFFQRRVGRQRQILRSNSPEGPEEV